MSAPEREDAIRTTLEQRLAEVREQIEQMARLPPSERDLKRWRELLEVEAGILEGLRTVGP